jgi:rubrerythrin
VSNQVNSFNDAFKIAINFEKEGREYYLSARDRCRHRLGKQMFASLADDEVGHMKRIKNLFDSFAEKGELPEELSLPRT